VINPRRPVRDIAIVPGRFGALVAAIDPRNDSLVLFAHQLTGGFTPIATLPTTVLPSGVESADLTADGLADIVVFSAGSGTATIFVADSNGNFGKRGELLIGDGASNLTLTDADSSGTVDIQVASQRTGNVSVFLNLGGAHFAPPLRFRAATSLSASKLVDGDLRTTSRNQIVELTGADLNHDGHFDLIAANAGSSSFDVFLGDSAGGLLNARRFAIDFKLRTACLGDVNSDGNLDLALLGKSAIEIYLGDGAGGFQKTYVTVAGSNPTGISIFRVDGDQNPDLAISNERGDLLVLRGNGDGSFQTFVRADRRIALAVVDLNEDGKNDYVYSDESLDRISIDLGAGVTTTLSDRASGLLAPSAIKAKDLNGDNRPDLIAANSGANEVLVYLNLGDGAFAPAQRFSAGTSPVALDTPDLNRDGLPDLLVTNFGSNDVSVFFGDPSATFVPGPRLAAQEGPISATLNDRTGPGGQPDGLPDLVVTNRVANSVSVLPAVGDGFFDDFNQLLQPIAGIDPIAGLPVDGSFVTLNRGSSDISIFSSVGEQRVSTGGVSPVAGITADINSDGFNDLLVASDGGVISFFLGGAAGLSLSQTLRRPDFAHPSDLQLAPDGNRLLLLGAGEGREAAVLLFSFDVLLRGTQGTESAAFLFALMQLTSPSGIAVLLGSIARETVTETYTAVDNDTIRVVPTLVTRPQLPLRQGEEFADAGAGQTEMPRDGSLADRSPRIKQNVLNFLLQIEQSLQNSNRQLVNRVSPHDRLDAAAVDEALHTILDESASPVVPNSVPSDPPASTIPNADTGTPRNSQAPLSQGAAAHSINVDFFAPPSTLVITVGSAQNAPNHDFSAGEDIAFSFEARGLVPIPVPSAIPFVRLPLWFWLYEGAVPAIVKQILRIAWPV
jgi:hypothetical protein